MAGSLYVGLGLTTEDNCNQYLIIDINGLQQFLTVKKVYSLHVSPMLYDSMKTWRKPHDKHQY